MAQTTIIGNIGAPELKFTPQGKAVLEFSLAENHSKKNQQGGWDEDGTTWRRVTIWEGKAEALANVLNKGDRVIAYGTERIREYDKKDGTKGQSLEMNAQHVGVIPRAQQAGQQQGGASNFASLGAQPVGGQGTWNAPAAGSFDTPATQGGWGAPNDAPVF